MLGSAPSWTTGPRRAPTDGPTCSNCAAGGGGSAGGGGAMVEEGRLFYLGLTRAENRVVVVRAFRRRVGGIFTASDPSRFLEDLPADLVEGDLLGMGLKAQAIYARQTRWESPAPRPIGPRFTMGMRVRHPSFGEGVVMDGAAGEPGVSRPSAASGQSGRLAPAQGLETT